MKADSGCFWQDPSLVLLPMDAREIEAQKVFAKREAAHKEQARDVSSLRHEILKSPRLHLGRANASRASAYWAFG